MGGWVVEARPIEIGILLVLALIPRQAQWIESATGTTVAKWIRYQGKVLGAKRGGTEACTGIAGVGWRGGWR